MSYTDRLGDLDAHDQLCNQSSFGTSNESRTSTRTCDMFGCSMHQHIFFPCNIQSLKMVSMDILY